LITSNEWKKKVKEKERERNGRFYICILFLDWVLFLVYFNLSNVKDFVIVVVFVRLINICYTLIWTITKGKPQNK
jgi:hypothetical protein